MQLYQAILAQVFGQGSRRPRRAALVRLAVLLALALGIGHMTASGFRDLPPSGAAPAYSLLLFAAIATQVSIGLVVLAGTSIAANPHDTLGRLLSTLPLKPAQRWLALQLPTLVLSGLAVGLIAEPFTLLFMKLGAPAWAMPFAGAAGLASSLGLLMGLGRRAQTLKLAVALLVVWLEYTLLLPTLQPATNLATRQTYTALLSAMVAGLSAVLIWTALRSDQLSTGRTHTHRALGQSLPRYLWLSKKLLRTANTRLSLITSVWISTGLLLVFRSDKNFDPAAISLLAAILAGSFVSDLRSLCRRLQPAEITALRGTYRFFVAECMTALPLALLSVAPLLSLAWRFTPPQLGMLGIQLGLGLAAGILATTVVAPQARDITGQFLTTVLCLLVLLGLPQLSVLRDLPLDSLAVVHIAIMIILVGSAYLVEYHRNPFVWRRKHHA